MATQKDAPNEKRPNDAFEPEHNKRMKPSTPEDPNAPIKITDLIDDCLEHIFKKLDINDLLSVADSSKHFKQAIDLVYKNKFGNKIVGIPKIQRTCGVVTAICDFVRPHDLKSTLRLLRCFGHLIAKLDIVYDKKGWPMIDQYINEYCANSLKKICLYDPPKDAMENTEKPFSKVKVVELILRVDVLERNINNFNKFFPQMQRLEIWNPDRIINRNCIEKHFPNLEHMKIGGLYEKNKNTSFNCSNIAEFMRLNPQLRSLTVCGDMLNAAFIQRTSEHLQRLESLEIICKHFFNLNGGVIHFMGLKEFTLDLRYGTNVPILNIPLSFDRLNTFKIRAGQFQVNSNFMVFINQHRSTLTKIDLVHYSNGGDPLNNTNKMKLATAMELMTDINLDKGILSMDEVINFLCICQSLKRLRFKLDPHSKSDDLMERISREWRFPPDYNGYITMER